MNRSYSFILGIFLLVWTSMPRNASDQMRAMAVDAFAPAWHCAAVVKEYLSDRPLGGSKQNDFLELFRLELENQRLKAQLAWVKEWILHDTKIHWERRPAYLSSLIDRLSNAIPAQVIYRDASSWSSSLWIAVGEEDNRTIGYEAITRNSPVVEGSHLVGVIDYVGKRQSRVRLITDSGLTPAVRVMRGGQRSEIPALVDALSDKIKDRVDLFEFVQQLQKIKEKVGTDGEEIYLAKGELHGNGVPFWRSRQPLLKGVGFNYDYADAEGPARELRTGRPLALSEKPLPLILEGDHLVTSGLDGVFPFGLSAAIVTKVFPLLDGNFSYEIEARPTAVSLNDLKVVFVLPSLSIE